MKVSNVILAVVLAVGFALPAAVQADNDNSDSGKIHGAFQRSD